MSNSHENGRPTSTIQRGKPATRGGNRSQRRAYEYQQNMAAQNNWAEARDFEERIPKPRGQTARSTAYRQKRSQPKQEKKDDAPVSYDFRSKEESSPIDEPLYDLGPHTSSIPVQEIYSQNCDFSGYIDQVERTYELLRGIDPRLDRRLPFSMFQHAMTTILNCHLLDTCLDNGEVKLGATRAQDLLPEDLCIPDNLYHYLSNVGNTITVSGEEVKFNLPEVAIPRAAADNVPSGSFGAVDAENHNVYECYVSPLVTANRVLNSRRAAGAPEIPPLPAALVPAGAQATRNLLGHGPPDDLQQEGRARLMGFEFPNGDTPAARLKISPELMSRVNAVLFELRDRFKMRDIGRSSPVGRNYLKAKTIPGNVQFVTVAEHVPDDVKLSSRQNQICSNSSFGSSTAGRCNVTVLHRARNANARGSCYTVNGAIPVGWLQTINNNYNMVGPFAPTLGVDNPALRVSKFISYASGGVRTTAIDNYIKRNFYVPAK